MSFFSGTASNSAGTGSNSLFGSLNLDTSVPVIADPAAKRKSIFEPTSTTEARKTNMFGTTPASTAGGGLFGLPATSAQASSMFGNAGTAATQKTPFSLNLGASTSTPAATGGLFGTTTATQPAAGGGLFGTTTAATKSLANAPPLASGSAPLQNTTTAPAFGSLFAAAAPTNNAPAFSLGQTNNLGQSNILGQSNAGPPQNNGTQQQVQNKESAYFNGLLERQKKKVKFDNNDQNSRLRSLPSMAMDLGDLTRRAQEMGQKSHLGQSTARDSRAHYLLSGSGINPGETFRDIQRFDNDSSITAPQTRLDLAEEGSAYIRGMQARGRDAMLRESMDRVYRDVDAFIEQSLGIDFDEHKKKIMQHFGLIPQDEGETSGPGDSFGRSKSSFKSKSGRRSVFGRSGFEKSIIGSANGLNGGTSFFSDQQTGNPTVLSKNQSIRDLREKERQFVQKVEELNQSRLQPSNFNILQAFKAIEGRVPGEVPKQLINAYSALEEITGESRVDGGLSERCFANAHAKDDADQRKVLDLKKQIINGSRSFLEKSFFRELEDVVNKNPRQAQLGGLPTTINKIRGYIRIRNEQHNLVPSGAELTQIGEDGDYCWAIIFYLLRSGHVKEAYEYVNNNAAFISLDRRFVGYLSGYAAKGADRRLSKKLQDLIDGVYNQITTNSPKNTVDPYKIACLKIIGRCVLHERNLEAVGQGVEDWMWLQFALARESDALEETPRVVFGLDQIVETITEIGQKHFQKSHADTVNSYGTFFQMQILAGMFEEAIDYLHTFNPTSAVHFAIALNYYGLLRVSNFEVAGNSLCELYEKTPEAKLTCLVTTSTTNKSQINFVPLVALYTSTFRAALPIQAVDYLALICLNSDLYNGETYTNACHEALRELCLETREFAALLGDISGDGRRLPGAIEKKSPIIRLDTHEQFLRSITAQAAAVADSRGQIADAVLLYHLCDDYDNVITVLNRAMADAIAVELGEEPMSLQPLRPRSTESEAGSQASQSINSSLSLTQSTSSPYQLAKNMYELYDRDAMYFTKISKTNQQTFHTLMIMLHARAMLESRDNPQFLLALTELNNAAVLPLDTRGNISAVRQLATSFSSLPQLVVRCAGQVILWCVRAIGAERERIAREGTWGIPGASEDDMTLLKKQLSIMAKDLMVFAGLVRYKLPSRVYDMLTKAGADVGGY